MQVCFVFLTPFAVVVENNYFQFVETIEVCVLTLERIELGMPRPHPRCNDQYPAPSLPPNHYTLDGVGAIPSFERIELVCVL